MVAATGQGASSQSTDVAAILKGAAQARLLVRPLLKSWYRFLVFGEENVPKRGPLLVVSNHLSIMDMPVLLAALPRPAAMLGRSESLAAPLGSAMAKVGLIDMDYQRPDFTAFAAASAVLAAGESVAMFPEQQRGDGQVHTMKHTVALLALVTGAPVLPAVITGTRKEGMNDEALPRRRSRIAVTFGQPFTISAVDDVYRRKVITAAGERIRQHLHDLVAVAVETSAMRLPVHPPQS